jgi:hypothetical protein
MKKLKADEIQGKPATVQYRIFAFSFTGLEYTDS